MKCTRCDTECSANARSCESCGKALGQAHIVSITGPGNPKGADSTTTEAAQAAARARWVAAHEEGGYVVKLPGQQPRHTQGAILKRVARGEEPPKDPPKLSILDRLSSTVKGGVRKAGQHRSGGGSDRSRPGSSSGSRSQNERKSSHGKQGKQRLFSGGQVTVTTGIVAVHAGTGGLSRHARGPTASETSALLSGPGNVSTTRGASGGARGARGAPRTRQDQRGGRGGRSSESHSVHPDTRFTVSIGGSATNTRRVVQEGGKYKGKKPASSVFDRLG